MRFFLDACAYALIGLIISFALYILFNLANDIVGILIAAAAISVLSFILALALERITNHWRNR